MRILLPTASFYPAEFGGPNNTYYWLCKGFVKVNCDVTVVATNMFIEKGKVECDKWLDVDGIKTIYLTSKKAKISTKVKRYAMRELKNCDVVITGGLCSIPFLLINISALLHKKKVIVSPRGELFEPAVNNQSKLKAVLKKIYFRLLRMVYGKKVIFHGTSADEIDAIKHFFGKRCRCAEIRNYMELPQRIPHIPNEKPYLLYVGRITKIKALDNLVRGLAQSEKFMNSNMRLLIVGENSGGYYEYLRAVISEVHLESKVEFTGLVTGDDKNRLYAGARFFYLMSHSENFGNVVMEAIAQGTPVVTSKGTPWKDVEANHCGFWVDNGVESIAEITDKVLSIDEEEYQLMRDDSYKFCSDTFDIHLNIHKWIEIATK